MKACDTEDRIRITTYSQDKKSCISIVVDWRGSIVLSWSDYEEEDYKRLEVAEFELYEVINDFLIKNGYKNNE